MNDTLETRLPFILDAGAGFEAYTWNGEVGDQAYEATQHGWQNVEVIDPDGCYVKDSIYLTSFTGIHDILLPGALSVYPIPASRYPHVKYSYAEAEILILDLYDSNGRIVLNREFYNVKEFTETLDVGDVARGMYYLRLCSENKEVASLITFYYSDRLLRYPIKSLYSMVM